MMSEPIVFVSHFRVKDRKRAGFEEASHEAAKLLHAKKPHTLAFLVYVEEKSGTASIVH